MGKKVNVMSYLYLIGMALIAVGFCCPMFKSALGSSNGFKFINFDNSGFVTIGALLIFVGAIAGIVMQFVGIKQATLIKLVCLIVSVVGGIILVVGFNDNAIYKAIAKGFLKHATVGFYLVIVGWVVSLCGWLTSK